jgi:thioredoxin reductase (NADPH)
MEEQARSFGAELVLGEVERVVLVDGGVEVRTTDATIHSRTLVVASGARERPLDVPGEAEFRGRGVSYCATCDGAFFRDRHVVVVGGGDSAIEEALFLTRFATRVTVIHRRDALRAARVLQERALAHPALDFLWDSVVTAVEGSDRVQGVRVRNVRTQQEQTLAADGVFVYIGLLPNSEPVRDLVSTDALGYIVTGEDMATSVAGIWAAGDVRAKYLRQVATAVGDGAIAGVSVERYLAGHR